jgi:hypothetical protein
MWMRNEVDEKKTYRVALCQHSNGRRNFALCPMGSEPPPTAVLITEVAPMDLLIRRDFKGLSVITKLTTGAHFFVDAHGTWLTGEECKAMNEDMPFSEVPWLNGLAPDFAPR